MNAVTGAVPAPAATGAVNPRTGDLRRQGLAGLSLAALGVVYGDIGTSPLYTMKAVFAPDTGVPLDAQHLIGAVSTIFWALMLVVTFKYVLLVLRADNRGEGGALALTALAAHAVRHRPKLRAGLLLLGVFGATLFYGDAVITPAISVLGAFEGLELATPALKPYVVPAALAVLIALFLFQRFGTAAVGKVFGPVIALWFITLGITGAMHIAAQPAILAALNPMHAVTFLLERGWLVLAAIGAVVLALTGAEALYADMGHFGAKPIRLVWAAFVMPALALNYMGQGALLMADPSAIDNPFFRLFPAALLIPAIVLATLAAIIASQAVISGAFSMTRQAIQLGFLPRMAVRFTSASEAGQIYMPAVNAAMLVGVLGTVLYFGSSAALATAYGIAVTLTMMVTTLLTWFVVRHGWHLPTPVALGATLFFLAVDALLVAGCAVKFFDGGWFPLLTGLLLFAAMSTWARGHDALLARIRDDGMALAPFLASLDSTGVQVARRTAIYPVADASTVPQALLHNLKHNQVLHERIVILTVVFDEVPWVGEHGRVEVEPLPHAFWRVTIHFGFMNTPDVPRALMQCEALGLPIAPMDTSYFISRQTVVPTDAPGLAAWRKRLFVALSRNASSVVAFFRLPDNAVVELGTRVRI